jgi:D-cysteine desulfhydrase
MGTVVGLALGLRMAGLDCTVVGVRVVNFTLAGPDRAQRLVDETMRWIQGIDPDVATPDSVVDSIEFRDEQFGDGYAIPTPASQEAAEIAREHARLMLDQTYSGKAFAALVHDARTGRLEGETPLFWNTYNSAPYPAKLDDVDTSTLPEQLKAYLAY